MAKLSPLRRRPAPAIKFAGCSFICLPLLMAGCNPVETVGTGVQKAGSGISKAGSSVKKGLGRFTPWGDRKEDAEEGARTPRGERDEAKYRELDARAERAVEPIAEDAGSRASPAGLAAGSRESWFVIEIDGQRMETGHTIIKGSSWRGVPSIRTDTKRNREVGPRRQKNSPGPSGALP